MLYFARQTNAKFTSGEAAACGEYQVVRKRRADDLESDWQTADRQGNGKRGEAENVDGADKARAGEAGVLFLFTQKHGGLADLRGNDGSGRGEEDIDILPNLCPFALPAAAEALGVDVVGGGEHAALINESDHVGAEFVAAVGVRLHEGGDFGHQDDAADDVQGFGIRDTDGFQFGASGFRAIECGLECGGDFRSEAFGEKIFRDAGADAAKRKAVSPEIPCGRGDGAVIARVVARDGIHNEGGVARGDGEGAHVVQIIAERHAAVAADYPVGRLVAGAATVGGGNTDRSA